MPAAGVGMGTKTADCGHGGKASGGIEERVAATGDMYVGGCGREGKHGDR